MSGASKLAALCATYRYMDMPLSSGVLCGLRTPILHSAMTKRRCSGRSERIWNTSRLELSTPVPCDSCVCQATAHRSGLKATLAFGETGFWDATDVRCPDDIKLKTWDSPPRTTVSTTNDTKNVELRNTIKWRCARLLRTAFCSYDEVWDPFSIARFASHRYFPTCPSYVLACLHGFRSFC